MDPNLAASLGKIGAAAAVSLAAVGSALGTGAAGSAAVGAWKRCFVQNKPAPYMLLAFIGAPITQIFYGMVLMNKIAKVATEAANAATTAAADVATASVGVPWPGMIAAGIFGGLAMGMSAWLQGRAGAAASDSFGETNKGFVNSILALGIIESVALFTMIFVAKAFV